MFSELMARMFGKNEQVTKDVETRSAELQLKPVIESPEKFHKPFKLTPPTRPQWERDTKSKMKLSIKQIKELRNSRKISERQAVLLESRHIENEDSLVEIGIDIAIASLIISELSNNNDTSFEPNDSFKSEAFQGGESGGGGAERDFSTPNDGQNSSPPSDSDSFSSSDSGSSCDSGSCDCGGGGGDF